MCPSTERGSLHILARPPPHSGIDFVASIEPEQEEHIANPGTEDPEAAGYRELEYTDVRR